MARERGNTPPKEKNRDDETGAKKPVADVLPVGNEGKTFLF